MGLFERTKHLERLAREIADQNLRQLGGAPVDKERTRKQVLELEAVLREYRLHLDEAEARKQLATDRVDSATTKASTWVENAAFAREKQQAELAEKAAQRAAVYDRERETAKVDADFHQSTVHRLRSEIADVERRIAMLRALRKGATPAVQPSSPPTRRTGATTRITAAPRDPLEEAFEQLRDG